MGGLRDHPLRLLRMRPEASRHICSPEPGSGAEIAGPFLCRCRSHDASSSTLRARQLHPSKQSHEGIATSEVLPARATAVILPLWIFGPFLSLQPVCMILSRDCAGADRRHYHVYDPRTQPEERRAIDPWNSCSTQQITAI